MTRGGKRQRCGRPALGARAKSEVLGVRVTEAERETILADAKAAGLNISEYIRSRTFRDRGAGCREV